MTDQRNETQTLEVIRGDIAQQPSDALITAINSGRYWAGGIDNVIYRTAGRQYHDQVPSGTLVDGAAFLTTNKTPHQGKFGSVIFVIDDLQLPLQEIVLAGLKKADDAGLNSVTLPAIRMGVMLGVVEKSTEEAVDQMSAGVRRFFKESPRSLKNIIFCVYGDEITAQILSTAMHRINSEL